MGAPTKLNDLLQKKIVAAVLAGANREISAQAAGVTATTLYLWLKKGREGDPIYSEFAEAVKKAEAEAEIEAVTTIRVASKTSWQAAAWWLERTRRERYALDKIDPSRLSKDERKDLQTAIRLRRENAHEQEQDASVEAAEQAAAEQDTDSGQADSGQAGAAAS